MIPENMEKSIVKKWTEAGFILDELSGNTGVMDNLISLKKCGKLENLSCKERAEVLTDLLSFVDEHNLPDPDRKITPYPNYGL